MSTSTIARETKIQHPAAAKFLAGVDYQRTQGFLADMAYQVDEYGRLSPRQWAVVERIMNERNTQAQATGRPADTPAAVGVYRKGGKLYVVREFTPQGESRKVRYAREIVPLTDAQGDRLNQQGSRVRIEERKAPGMQYRLAQADALPLEEVTALSIQWESCLVCGRHLRVAESVVRGIGPVCHGRQAALLGG